MEPAELRQVLRQRRSRPLLVVDLGVPRNVSAKAGKIENVFLHDLDSLQHLIARNLERRRDQVPAVEEMIAEELRHFRLLVPRPRGRAAGRPAAEPAEQIRRQELDGVRGRFPSEPHDDLDRLTRALVRKILHHPTTRLRAGRPDRDLAHLEVARDLFQLDEDEE